LHRISEQGFILDRNAVDQNEDQRNDVHQNKHSNDDVLHINIRFSSFRHTDQHPADTEFDWDDSRAIANFEDQKKLVNEKLVWPGIASTIRVIITFCASAAYFSLPGFARVVV
jgi:hypothetical protein